MAYFHRLIALLALLLFASAGHALECTQWSTGTAGSQSPLQTSVQFGWADSRAQACNYSLNTATAANPTSTATFTASAFSTTCQIFANGSIYYIRDYATRTGNYCPDPPPPQLEACLPGTVRAKDGVRCLTQLEKDCDDRAPNSPSGPLDIASDASWAKPSTICDGTAVSTQDSNAGPRLARPCR